MVERRQMRRRVNAASQPRGDDETLECEIGRDLAREFLSDRRAVAGADDGDDRNVGKIELAFGIEEGWRRIDLRQRGRIARLTDRD